MKPSHTHFEAQFARSGKILRGEIGVRDLATIAGFDPRRSGPMWQRVSPDRLWGHWIAALRIGLEPLMPHEKFTIEPMTRAEFEAAEAEWPREIRKLAPWGRREADGGG